MTRPSHVSLYRPTVTLPTLATLALLLLSLSLGPEGARAAQRFTRAGERAGEGAGEGAAGRVERAVAEGTACPFSFTGSLYSTALNECAALPGGGGDPISVPPQPWCCVTLAKVLRHKQGQLAAATGQLALTGDQASLCLSQLAQDVAPDLLAACSIDQASMTFPGCWTTVGELQAGVPGPVLDDILENCDDFASNALLMDPSDKLEDEGCNSCYGRMQKASSTLLNDTSNACTGPLVVYALSRYQQQAQWDSRKAAKGTPLVYPITLHNLTSCELSISIVNKGRVHQCPFPPSWIATNLDLVCARQLAVPPSVSGNPLSATVGASLSTPRLCSSCMAALIRNISAAATSAATSAGGMPPPLGSVVQACISPGLAAVGLKRPLTGAAAFTAVAGGCAVLQDIDPGTNTCSLDPDRLSWHFARLAPKMCPQGEWQVNAAVGGPCGPCLSALMSSVVAAATDSQLLLMSSSDSFEICAADAIQSLEVKLPQYNWKNIAMCAQATSNSTGTPTNGTMVATNSILAQFTSFLRGAASILST